MSQSSQSLLPTRYFFPSARATSSTLASLDNRSSMCLRFSFAGLAGWDASCRTWSISRWRHARSASLRRVKQPSPVRSQKQYIVRAKNLRHELVCACLLCAHHAVKQSTAAPHPVQKSRNVKHLRQWLRHVTWPYALPRWRRRCMSRAGGQRHCRSNVERCRM